MNLALLWCWKEWRAQRALLGAYSGLVFASLCCVFLLVGDQFWLVDGNRVHVLGWFVGAGVIGVLAFAVPQFVRGEFTTKDDGFVRRLPGALRPAFLGKLLFLALTAASLPLLGLALGEVFLTAIDKPWDDLFSMTGNAYSEVYSRWPAILVYGAWAMVFVPWVWVLAAWLPGGRMAIGGTALLALLLGLGVFAVLRRCEGLGPTLAWRPWAVAAVPFGLLLAGILTRVRGRRGGSNGRSARIGLVLFGIGLVPPAAWLGSNAYDYHHPDLDNLAVVRVEGLSPDARFAIGHGTSNEAWYPVPLRFDLQSGSAEQIGGIGTWFGRGLQRPVVNWSSAPQRYWHLADSFTSEHWLFDLESGERFAVAYDEKAREVILPDPQREPVLAEQREHWPFRAPGGLRANVVGGELLLEQADGSLRREPWPKEMRRSGLQRAGHGIVVWDGGGRQLYDLTHLRLVSPPGVREPGGYAVRGVWVMYVAAANKLEWRRFDSAQGSVEPCPELKGCSIFCLFDDDRLLCERREKNRTEWLLYRPADRELTLLQLPDEFRRKDWRILYLNVHANPTLGGLDRFGRLWLQDVTTGRARRRPCIGCMMIDPATLAVDARIVPLWGPEYQDVERELVEVLDEHTVLAREGAEISRVDTDTGARTVLFPRRR